ncbi:hypothetical protein LNP17_10535 [Klebsiella variicola subsp. variicola]|nr:hypothetical protein [Klebsiella variicola subsp. variicola]
MQTALRQQEKLSATKRISTRLQDPSGRAEWKWWRKPPTSRKRERSPRRSRRTGSG